MARPDVFLPARPRRTYPQRTCVFFHAHPDDEAQLTAGTMACLAAEEHRMVLVVATAEERGLAACAPGREITHRVRVGREITHRMRVRQAWPAAPNGGGRGA